MLYEMTESLKTTILGYPDCQHTDAQEKILIYMGLAFLVLLEVTDLETKKEWPLFRSHGFPYFSRKNS